MSIGSTRKIESTVSSASKADRAVRSFTHNSQTVESIDTTNNVLVRDENENQERQDKNSSQQRAYQPDFKNSTADISSSIEALAITATIQENENNQQSSKPQNQIDIYSNNQSILKDEDVEKTGRTYLKHLYEKNEYLTDIDELV